MAIRNEHFVSETREKPKKNFRSSIRRLYLIDSGCSVKRLKIPITHCTKSWFLINDVALLYSVFFYDLVNCPRDVAIHFFCDEKQTRVKSRPLL